LAFVNIVREAFHVFERHGVDAGDRAKCHVAVGCAPEDIRLEPFFAELLLIVRTQVLHELVQLTFLDAAEVLFTPSRIDQLRKRQLEKPLPTLAVNRAREGGHFLVSSSPE
jgi:hypothetical protein